MLKGKNAIVTGSSRGLGRAITERFLQNGANVWACSHTENPGFAALGQLAAENGVWVKPVLFDLTDDAALNAGMRGITAEKLPVDILVNNAGRSSADLFLNSPSPDIRALFDLDFFAQLEMCRLVGKKMIAQRTGCILNMVSYAGLNAEVGRVAYGSAKAALVMATQIMAKEFGRFGVRVNAIAPGVIENRAGDGSYTPGQIERFTAQTALGRMGTPSQVADAALFLASGAAGHITGEVLRVDGGRL